MCEGHVGGQCANHCGLCDHYNGVWLHHIWELNQGPGTADELRWKNDKMICST